ncbi:family 78 glycoside hydrolase catalytic domain [Oxalobacteraceae bacterium A2-2]
MRHQLLLRLCALLYLLSVQLYTNTAWAVVLRPVGLQAEGRQQAEGVDNPHPLLDWRLAASGQRDVRQSAYRILVASSPARLASGAGDLWDSGKVSSGQTRQIAYRGKPLRSSQAVYWKVRSWDQAGQAGAWSEPAQWAMGVLDPQDWRGAAWIGYGDGMAQSALLRKDFTASAGLLRATAHVSGLGLYELRANGAQAGDAMLTPGWTHYGKTVLYDSHDLTGLLHTGANTIALVLGNGMYSVEKTPARYNKFHSPAQPQKAILLLQLDYRDGHSEWVVSDGSWQAGPSPITYSNVYGGEDIDARRVQAGWDAPGFAAAGWEPARLAAAPAGRLRGLSAAALPIRLHENLAPQRQQWLQPGLGVIDLGQNAALLPAIAVRGRAGDKVRITGSELLKPDGAINDTMTGGRAYWEYTLAGTGEEHWRPTFFYRGARYLQVELIPARPGGELPQLLSVQGRVLHADAPAVGSFRSSSELYNRISAAT